MKCIAFAASTSSTSINKKLATVAVSLLSEERPGTECEVIDLRDYAMPMFSEDEERENGVPDAARKLLERIGAADALIISFAEHNGSYTAAYKNTFDWMTRMTKRVYEGKRVLALSTSPGPGGAASVLKSFTESAHFFGAELVGSLSVPAFNDVYDKNPGTLADEWKDKVRELVASL